MHQTHLNSIDLNLLVVLHELLETRSVTEAAKRLQRSQPATSRALARLRVLLGDPLFVRTRSGLMPTPRAEERRGELESVLGRIEALVSNEGAFDPMTATRSFTVIAADYAMAVLMPAVMERLAREAPKMSIRVVGPSPLWESQLADGQAHLMWAPQRKAAQTIVWTKLFDEGFGFVVRRGHPATRGAFTLERFLKVRQVAIAPEGQLGNPQDTLLANLGVRRQVVAQVTSFLVVAPLVAQCDLGAALPRRIIEQQATRWGLVELKLPFSMYRFTSCQAWHERFRHDPGHAWFRQCVASVSRTIASRRG